MRRAARAGRQARRDQFPFARGPHRQAFLSRSFARRHDAAEARRARTRSAGAEASSRRKGAAGERSRSGDEPARAERHHACRRTIGCAMTRANLVLLGLLIACALAVVTSQHQARKLYVELQKEQELAKVLDVEWGQVQLEQSTWAAHPRIEKIAARE